MEEKMHENTGESNWGPVLAELSLLSDVFLPLKSSARIKYLSFDVSKYYLVFGASTGSIYIFQRNPLKFLQVLANKDGAITQISLAPDDNLIGYSTSKGLVIVMEHNIDKRGNQTPKRLQLSYEHKNSQVTALKWNSSNSRLFAGDDKGRVSVVNILTSKARILLQLPTVVIMRLDSKVVQLDFAQNKLVASTLTKCFLCDTIEEQYTQIGKKPRDGHFGVCFHAGSKLQTPLIYASRPGSRLWEVDYQGTVLNTHHFKDALALPPQLVITKGCESKLSSATGNYPPQNVNFGRILSLGNKYLVTWTDNSLYIFDPSNASVVLWTDAFHGIRDIKCYKFNLFISMADGCLRTVRLISPDKLIQYLITHQEWVLAAHVALNYQSVLTDTNSHHRLPPTALREVQSHLMESSEVQLANCIDLVANKMEAIASSSVSSSISGRSGSTDSYSRHESGVLIVNPKATPASDSDDDAHAQMHHRFRMRHMRSSSGGRYRTASSPRVASVSSTFRPVSPGSSLTLPRRSQRTKSASPACIGDTGVAVDGLNEVSAAKHAIRERDNVMTRSMPSTKSSAGLTTKGTRSSAFSKVTPRKESAVRTKDGATDDEMKIPKVPAEKDSEVATHIKVKKMNKLQNKNLQKDEGKSEKGKITLMFPCYMGYGMSVEQTTQEDFVSVSITTPTVLSDLKETLSSTIQSGKETLWQTMEEVGDKIKKRGGEIEEELLDVRKEGDDVDELSEIQEVPLVPQDEFRVKYLKSERFPVVEGIQGLIEKSKSVTGVRELKEWFKVLNECQVELERRVSELVKDQDELMMFKGLVFVRDPFGMTLSDHEIVSKAARLCFEEFNQVYEVGNTCVESEGECRAPYSDEGLRIDAARSDFVIKFFHLLDAEETRSCLLKTSAPRFKTWLAVVKGVEENLIVEMGEECLVDVSKFSEKEVCRIVAAIKRLLVTYPSQGIENCVRSRYLTSIDVLYLCRCVNRPSYWLESYLNKMLTGSWFGLNSFSIVDLLSGDEEFHYVWTLYLLSTNASEEGKCSCGLPSPWAHINVWPQGNTLWQLVKKKSRWERNILEQCFKLGYWPGYLHLNNRLKERKELARIVIQLGDVHLIDCDSDYGFFPECEDEWRLLLTLVAKQRASAKEVTCLNCESKLVCSKQISITWNRIANLLLQHLGPEDVTLNLLHDVADDIPPNEITGDYLKDFFGLSLLKMEQKSLSTSCDLSQTNSPFFLGSELYHLFQAEKHQAEIDGELSRVATGAAVPKCDAHHWGLPLKLHDDCAVCSLPLILGTSASVHGIVILSCGHVFHRSCLETRVCALCDGTV